MTIFKTKNQSIAAIALALTIGTATVAFATEALSLPSLNKKIAEVLKEFNNEKTRASFVVKNLKMSTEKRAEALEVEAKYARRTQDNQLVAKLGARYQYGEGKKLPTVQVKLNAQTDVAKILEKMGISKDVLWSEADKMIADLQVQIKNYVSQYYGDAAQLEFKYSKKMGEGNEISEISFSVVGKTNLKKLPKNMPIEEIPVLALQLKGSITLKGVNVEGNVGMNPKFKSFQENQLGLKELIERLLKEDNEILNNIVQMMAMLDLMAGGILGENK